MRKYSRLILSMIFFLLTNAAMSAPASNSAQTNSAETAAQSSAPPSKANIESRTLSVRIDQPFATVYQFLADPANWNKWAFGLGKSLRRSNDGWIADSGDGLVKVRFTARNQHGVLDHTVIRPSGTQVYVPMGLIANGSGCELLFTLFREPDITDERYNADTDFVQRDLNRLKEVLEK
jgi:hypothetical protein